MNSSLPGTDPKTNFSRLRIAAVLLTLFGLGLFGYFVYTVGFWEILNGIARFGFAGFAVILTIYFVRICLRAYAWKLSVHEPYSLSIRDTVPAVVIGEALSSTIPLGILISGTSKAIAVRSKIPLVAGLSSVATENLFYSLITGLFLIAGAAILIAGFALDSSIALTLYLLIAGVALLTFLGLLMVIRQWHFSSWICNWLYAKGILKRLLENGRHYVRRFEDLIYGFYRRHPNRFVPICLLEIAYHILGVCEVWFILSRLGGTMASFRSAFLLESVSRLVTIVFKLVPFMIGVDEAGAQLVGEAIALAAGVGVTLAIIRKGRILFWAAVGMALIANRGLHPKDLSPATREAVTAAHT